MQVPRRGKSGHRELNLKGGQGRTIQHKGISYVQHSKHGCYTVHVQHRYCARTAQKSNKMWHAVTISYRIKSVTKCYTSNRMLRRRGLYMVKRERCTYTARQYSNKMLQDVTFCYYESISRFTNISSSVHEIWSNLSWKTTCVKSDLDSLSPGRIVLAPCSELY